MGNNIDNSFLNKDAIPTLQFLTKCKTHSGSSSEIAKLFKQYISTHDSSGFFILKSTLKEISKDTPLKGFEEIAYTFFHLPEYQKLSFMELIACIIAYSLSTWQVKVKLAFLAFDFDESKTITKDEMTIMVIAFAKGIRIITQSTGYNASELELIARHCFEMADSTPDGYVTIEELTNWVGHNPVILSVLKRHQLKRSRPTKSYDFTPRYLTKRNRPSDNAPKTPINRANSISISFTGRKLPRKTKKTLVRRPSNSLDVNELQGLFTKVANRRGFATVNNLYEVLSESLKFSNDTDFFFHEFGFNKKREIQFTELLEYFKKRRDKSGYGIQRGKIVFKDFQAIEGESANEYKKINRKVLENMFKMFDKNNDGVLTVEELANGLRGNFSQKAIQEMFESYDKDRNHLLDFDEFLELFRENNDNQGSGTKKGIRNAN